MEKDNKIRLQKIIADAGISSRRKAEELIERGAVTVNGRKASLGDKADPFRDKITVAGREITLRKDAKKYYIMLQKPRGFITTMNDEGGRKCVAELVDDIPARLFPVGRLDRESEGMLLMTNDGNFANMISHPSTHIAKTYRVTVRPRITEDQLTRLTTGVVIEGRMSMPAVSYEPISICYSVPKKACYNTMEVSTLFPNLMCECRRYCPTILKVAIMMPCIIRYG